MELLKKITSKSVMGGKVEKPDEHIDLYTVYGIATGVRTGESTFGPWNSLTGSFEAVRVGDGEVFASSQCFLPEPMNGIIAGQLGQDESPQGIQFAVMVGVKPADTATGYEYTTSPLMKPSENDALSSMRDIVKALPAASKKQLPAPLKTPVPSKSPVKKKGGK